MVEDLPAGDKTLGGEKRYARGEHRPAHCGASQILSNRR